jgi:hypothetical protein
MPTLYPVIEPVFYLTQNRSGLPAPDPRTAAMMRGGVWPVAEEEALGEEDVSIIHRAGDAGSHP